MERVNAPNKRTNPISNIREAEKKLHKQQIKDLDKAVKTIFDNPTIGDVNHPALKDGA